LQDEACEPHCALAVVAVVKKMLAAMTSANPAKRK
jgi:hypothetical protein